MTSMLMDIAQLYSGFDQPCTPVDCGKFCSEQNPNGKPFCCDICFAVPAAYKPEWDYLKYRTQLWHQWQGDECIGDKVEKQALDADIPDHMLLLACLGPGLCQRQNRLMSCRQFPFFPYITADDRFIGMTYNWDFEPFCWVISNLEDITPAFRKEFISTYDQILSDWPDDYDSYYFLSEDMRVHFKKVKRYIPVLHRNGRDYLLNPEDDSLVSVSPIQFEKFGPYKVS